MARKIYPSQQRYRDKNPIVNFVMKREDKERIDKMVESSGKSRSELLRVALFGLEKDFSKAYNEAYSGGYDKGFEDAKEEYRIWFHYPRCGGNIHILPNSAAHRAIIDYIEKEGWDHSGCNLK